MSYEASTWYKHALTLFYRLNYGIGMCEHLILGMDCMKSIIVVQSVI
jgi:hypothetical protein